MAWEFNIAASRNFHRIQQPAKVRSQFHLGVRDLDRSV